MSELRIKEALEKVNAKKTDGKITLIDVGREIWPDSETHTQRNSISNLVNNKASTIKIEWVSTLCKVLECDANFLFNIEGKKEEPESVDLYKIKLNDSAMISEGVKVTRVPGGWVYELKGKDSVFVPFSTEFQPKKYNAYGK